jgi:hypothetical protein
MPPCENGVQRSVQAITTEDDELTFGWLQAERTSTARPQRNDMPQNQAPIVCSGSPFFVVADNAAKTSCGNVFGNLRGYRARENTTSLTTAQIGSRCSRY